MSPDCPTTDQLEALLRGNLPDRGQFAYEPHLESCASCQQRLESLAAGDLRGTPRPGSIDQPPSLDRVMQMLKATGATGMSGPTSDPLLSPGTALRYFGDYEILEELGRGGMGVVYRARQVSLDRTVALKLILAGPLASPSEVRRFRNEAEAAARLDHPNIVPIYEIGEHEGRHYFSMKLVEGRPLSERISNFKSEISNGEVVKLLAKVARAVHYAHQRGILHRDLKPANILLDARGEPHLTDFGLAKLMESDSGLTRSQAILGTPDYMAPEVAAGKAKEVTTATDIFSLGAILYELLTGQLPFRGETTAATLQNVLNAEPRRPRTIDPGVPRDLETITVKCLEKEPARRYASAAAVAEELERFARGETILARSVTPPERVWRWARRKSALAALVVALHLALTFGLAGITWQWQRARQLAVSEARERERAEANFQKARDAVNRMVSKVAEQLDGVPRMEETRRLLLLDALAFHQDRGSPLNASTPYRLCFLSTICRYVNGAVCTACSTRR